MKQNQWNVMIHHETTIKPRHQELDQLLKNSFIKRILIAVDLTEMDEILIRYITNLSNEISLDKVYFLNVVKNLTLPKRIIKKYPDLVAPIDESSKKEIQYTIDQKCGGKLNVEYEINVAEGNRAEQILKWASIKEVDLIVLGSKPSSDGKGIVSRKVAKLASCSVFFIPKTLPNLNRKIVVPINHNPSSKLALEFAIQFGMRLGQTEITCLNTYCVPTGYHMSGKSYEEFAEIMRQNAENSFKKFIAGVKTKHVKVNVRFELDEHSKNANRIHEFAIKEKASILVIGSEGQTWAASIIVGSISEQLIKLNTQVPIMIVKQKKNMNFLEALYEI